MGFLNHQTVGIWMSRYSNDILEFHLRFFHGVSSQQVFSTEFHLFIVVANVESFQVQKATTS